MVIAPPTSDCCSMSHIMTFSYTFMQRAKKENAKMREQIEKQRLAREREVCNEDMFMS